MTINGKVVYNPRQGATWGQQWTGGVTPGQADAVFNGPGPAFGTPEYSAGSAAQKQLWDLAGSIGNPINQGFWNSDVVNTMRANLTPQQFAAALQYAQSLPTMPSLASLNR
jgi:hypothetical protein